MKISELKPFAKKVDLTVKALSKNEVREVASKKDSSTHRVTEALVGDESGSILLTLWDDGIDRIEVGKVYKITNGFTSLFQKSLRLNLGRFGTMELVSEDVTVDESNNVSEKEVALLSIADLKPFVKKVDLIAKALSKNEIREVTAKDDNSTHRVTEALIADESGAILLTLWDGSIDKVEIGKTYKIGNAFTSLFQRSLRLNLGQFGTLEDAPEPLENINEANNLSQKEFEQPKRFSSNNDSGGDWDSGGGRNRESRGGGNRNRSSRFERGPSRRMEY